MYPEGAPMLLLMAIEPFVVASWAADGEPRYGVAGRCQGNHGSGCDGGSD